MKISNVKMIHVIDTCTIWVHTKIWSSKGNENCEIMHIFPIVIKTFDHNKDLNINRSITRVETDN